MVATVLIAVFGNAAYVAIFFPACFFVMFIIMVVVITKYKPTHSCPVCLNEIGKTGTTIRW